VIGDEGADQLPVIVIIGRVAEGAERERMCGAEHHHMSEKHVRPQANFGAFRGAGEQTTEKRRDRLLQMRHRVLEKNIEGRRRGDLLLEDEASDILARAGREEKGGKAIENQQECGLLLLRWRIGIVRGPLRDGEDRLHIVACLCGDMFRNGEIKLFLGAEIIGNGGEIDAGAIGDAPCRRGVEAIFPEDFQAGDNEPFTRSFPADG